MEFERTLTATTDAFDELPAGDGGVEMGRRGTVGRFVLLDTLGAGVHTDVHSLLVTGLIEREQAGFCCPYDAVHVDFILTAALLS